MTDPEEEDVQRRPVTVASFLEAAAGPLSLSLAAGGAGLTHTIKEAALNRPGLALSGFYQYFARHRIQVLGFAEHAYLSSLSPKERSSRLREFFQARIPCVVVARGKKVFPAIQDLSEEFGVPVLKTKMITKHFINAATITMENLTAPRGNVQGTMVEIMGVGVLIEGKAGTGKSETALGLIRKGYALVSDDITAFRVDSSGRVIGAPVDVTRYHMEIRGIGIIHVPSLFGVTSVRREKKLDLVATLCAPDEWEEVDRSGETVSYKTLLGQEVPRVYIPVAAGRDLANVVEVAALDQKLKMLGHDAVKELDERLIMMMTEGTDASE